MARAQSQYLRIYDGSGTYQRWQSYYVNTTVTWDSAAWIYQDFAADGITAGVVGDESGMAVTLPATSIVMETVDQAISNGWLADLSIYQFDSLLGNTAPQAGQELIAAFTGEIVGAKATLTSITLQLGSAVSPVGAQIPPRKLTTRIMGKGCIL